MALKGMLERFVSLTSLKLIWKNKGYTETMSYIIIFPGQGAQTVGMGSAFVADPIYAEHLQQVDQILGFELSQVMHEGPVDKLQQTFYAQLALFTMETGLYRLWRQYHADAPLAVAGHSLGEYSALVAAGALRFEDALLLVKERAKAMQAVCEQQAGSMAAVIRPDLAYLEALCQAQQVVIANYNSPKQLVLSGETQLLEQAIAQIKAQSTGKVIPLKVSGAFHSPLMRAAADQLVAILAKTTFQAPDFPVVMNHSAQARLEIDRIRSDLQAQMCASVRWQESVLCLEGFQPRHWIELGPGTLTTLLKQSLRGVCAHTPQRLQDLISCAQTI